MIFMDPPLIIDNHDVETMELMSTSFNRKQSHNNK